MLTKKGLKKEIDMASDEIIKLCKENIFNIEIEKGDVCIERIQVWYPDEKSIKLTVPELKDKADKDSVKELINTVNDLTNVVEKQLALIKKICPHKDVEVSKEHVEMFHFDSFRKTCIVCGHVEVISEAEYYSMQKGVIDAKIKELND